MRTMHMRSRAILCSVVVVGLSAITQPAAAVVYDLRAAPTTMRLRSCSWRWVRASMQS